MKTGILITARLGSTRLERKHLLPVLGRPIISFLIERIRNEFLPEISKGEVEIVIATSDEAENRAFEQFAGAGLSVFYGDVHNIPLRHLQAAKAGDLAAIVAVDGDDILCSVQGMRVVYEQLRQGTPYLHTTGLPLGMNSMGYARPFLERSLQGHAQSPLETGWGRIFDDGQRIDMVIPFPHQSDALRFTLDYEEDYRFFAALIQKCGSGILTVTDAELARIALDEGVFKINEPISKQYWENFHRLKREEMEMSEKAREKGDQ